MDRVPNIAGRARTLRLILGAVSLGVAASYLYALYSLEASSLFVLGAFLPLLGAAYGFIQFREKT